MALLGTVGAFWRSVIAHSSVVSPRGQSFETLDGGGVSNPPIFDPTSAAYLANPAASVVFEISKPNFDAVFMALGGSQEQADAKFAQLDNDGDGLLDPGDLLNGGKNGPALYATPPPDLFVAVPPIDAATSLLWTAGIAPSNPTRASPEGQPQSTAPSLGDLPVGPSSSSQTGGLNWMSADGMGVFFHAPATQNPTASYAGNPPPPISFEISKSDFETVYTQLGGALDQADLLFAKMDQDGNGTLDQDNLLNGAKNLPPALTATNAPAGPAGLASPSSELGVPTVLGNPPPLAIR